MYCVGESAVIAPVSSIVVGSGQTSLNFPSDGTTIVISDAQVISGKSDWNETKPNKAQAIRCASTITKTTNWISRTCIGFNDNESLALMINIFIRATRTRRISFTRRASRASLTLDDDADTERSQESPELLLPVEPPTIASTNALGIEPAKSVQNHPLRHVDKSMTRQARG